MPVANLVQMKYFMLIVMRLLGEMRASVSLVLFPIIEAAALQRR